MGTYTVFILMQIYPYSYCCLYLALSCAYSTTLISENSFGNEWKGNSQKNRAFLVIKDEHTWLALPSGECVALGGSLGLQDNSYRMVLSWGSLNSTDPYTCFSASLYRWNPQTIPYSQVMHIYVYIHMHMPDTSD